MCTRSAADKKWAEACCREYCNFCNTTIPKKQNCDGTCRMLAVGLSDLFTERLAGGGKTQKKNTNIEKKKSD